MKQKFKWLLALVAMVASVNLMAEAVTQTYTLSNNDNGKSVITDKVSWTIGSGAIEASSSNMKLTGTITVTLPTGATLTKVEITKSNNWGSGATVTFATGTTTLNTFSNSGTFDLTKNKTDLVYTFTKSGTSTKNAWVKEIKVTYTPSAAPTVAYTVTLKDDNTTLTEASAGAGVALPSRETSCTDYTFAGWSETNCETETTTAPTIIEAGEYKPTKNIELYPVFKKEEKGTSENASVTIPGYATAHSWQGSGAVAYKSITVDDNITVTTTGTGNNGKYYSDWRLYQSGDGNAIVTAKAGKISSVTFTFTVANTGALKYGNTAVTSGTAVKDINASSVTFTVGNTGSATNGQVKITKIDVTYSGDPTIYYVATPTCSSASLTGIAVSGTPAEFWKGDSFNHNGITVTANYDDATSEDVTSKAEFSTPDMTTVGEQTITVTYKEKTATYTIDVKTIANTQATAYTTAKAIEIIDAGKDLATQVYVKGTVSKVNGYYSNKYITYFLDEDAFEIYNGLGKEGAAFSSKDDIQVEDEVVVYGKLTKHSSVYEFAQDNQLVSLTRPKKLTSITISRDPAQETIFDTETSFDHKGISVIAHYNTGASDNTDVTENAEFTAPDMTTTGEKTVNVSYTENEITKETSYKINVGSHCNTPVTITKGTPEHGSFTLSAEGNQCADGLVVTVTPTADEHYNFKQITATNSDVDNNAMTVSNITANTTINVEFEEDPKVTVKWHVGSAAPVETADVYVGTAFADVKTKAPSVADNAAGDCANKFMGWATSAITAQDGVDEDDVAWATEPISNENKEFYAVWAKGVENKQEGKPVETGGKGKSAITEITGVTQSGLGDDYTSHSPYLLKFDNTGDYIQFALDYAPKTLSFGYKMIGGNNQSTMTIQECATTDGSYTKVQDFTISGSQNSTGTKTTTSTFSQKYVRMYFTKGSNIGVGNITIEGYVGGTTYSNYITSCFIPTYSVTIQPNNTTMGTVEVDPEITEDAYKAGTEFAVMAEPTDDQVYRFAGWTITPDNTGATLDDATSSVVTFTTGTGDVTLTANFEAIPADPITVTLEVGEHGTLACKECEENTITEGTAGDGVLVPDVIANEGWAFLGWSTSSTATEAQYKPADADIFYPSDDNKTLYAVYAQLYKVTLKYTDEVKWQETAGGAITLPTDRNCKNATYKDHFAGWSEIEFAEETTNPTETPTIYEGSITPTKDVVLYPVFSVSTMGGTKWVKTTGDQVTGGVYAILCSSEKAFNGSKSDGHGQVTETAFSFDANGVATSAPTGTCEVTLTAVTGGFTMYNSSIGYIYATKAGSGGLSWHNSEDSYWYWGGTSNQNWIYKANSAYLRSASGSSIRTYGANNGDGPVHFAKKESVAKTKYWSKPANDVTNPVLDTPAGDYLSPLTVKITEDSYDNDLIYYYTTDGTTPAAIDLEPQGNTQEYEPSTGIVLDAANTYTVKLIGYDEDGYTSQIASAEYHIYPIFTSISDMYAGATTNKPVGLVLTNAYVHAVNDVNGNSQIFVQQGDLGVVLSVPTANVPEGVEAGKQISGTAIGTYEIKNSRPQISKFAFQSTFSVSAGSRPEPTTITQTTADLVSTHLLRLVKLEGVYAQSDASNIIVVNSNNEGTGTASNVYDFFNKVSTIPASDIECNVIGLFNERKNGNDPIVYSIMPILATDFDVVEKQDATLPTVSPLGSTVEAEPTKVASGETVTITPAAGFTTSYTVNGGEKQTITAQSVPVTITESNTTIVVEATRPYYNTASATYYYEIDPGLTKYHITLPSVQTYYKIVSDVTDQKAGETVTLTISNITEHWNITGVTVEKADDATTTVEVANPETNIYTFVMPTYAVNVKVGYQSDPTYSIDYLRGITGSTGDNITESKQYAGVELTLKECTWKAAGYTFKNWYAYYLDEESQEVAITITDNKITVPAHDVKIKAMWDEAAWHKDGTWELVTKTTELGVGDYVIFTETKNAGTENDRLAGTSTVKKAGEQLALTNNIAIADNKLSRLNNDGSMVFQVEEGNVENTYAFYADGIGYLNANGDVDDKNYMITSESKESNNASWAIESIDATTGEAVVKAKSSRRNMMQINTTSSIFAAYGSKQGGLAIYKFYPKAWIVTFDDNVEDEEIEVPEMQRADPTTNEVTISTMVPERTGYDFSIWNSAKGGTGVISAEPGDEITLSQNTTLYAQWSIKQYNVAVAEVENVTIQAKPYSEEVIAEGGNANVNFKKSVVLSYSELNEDYVFKSWKVTKADDETTVVPISVGSSTTFEVPAYAVKVSAVIESKATTQLTVTYHANGGKNKTAGDPEEVSEQVNWNTTIKFAEHPCPFEKNLCTFVGWNTKADGTGTPYKTQVTVKTDIDLYAMWQASAVEYVIDNNVGAKVKVQEGVAPAGSTATFETTYTGTFGQLTKNNYGTLTLTGFDGKVITGVTMEMRTNNNDGAGTIVVNVGETEICSTSYSESFGSCSSTYSVASLKNFVPTIVGNEKQITIVTSATTSSLYIKGYTIEYEDAEATAIRDNLTAGQYTTYCEPYAVVAGSYSGATFWNIADKTYMTDGQRLNSITIEQYTGNLEAGVPYIMLPEDAQLTGVQYGEAVANPVEEGNNGLYGTFVDYAFDENEAEARDAQQLYVISNGTLYLCGTGCGVYANRAYIKSNMITPAAPTGAPRRTIGRPNDTPTTLNGLFDNQDGKAQKALINGNIYILRDNKMYNAQGQFVK